MRLDSGSPPSAKAWEPPLLWDGQSGFCFPLARVGKRLENGADDSVRVFAQGILARTGAGA